MCKPQVSFGASSAQPHRPPLKELMVLAFGLHKRLRNLFHHQTEAGQADSHQVLGRVEVVVIDSEGIRGYRANPYLLIDVTDLLFLLLLFVLVASVTVQHTTHGFERLHQCYPIALRAVKQS